MAIKWEKWGAYSIKTVGYSISKSLVQGEWLYTLWKLPTTMIGNYKDVNDAKKAHLETIKGKPTEPDQSAGNDRLQPRLASDYRKSKG